MIAPYQQPCNMRDDQSQKADGADDGSRNTHQQHRDHRNDDPAAGNVHAQAPRRFILQRQQVALAQHKDRSNQANHHIQKQGLKIIPGLHSNVRVDNAGGSRIGAARAGVEGAHQTGKHGVDRYADENNTQGRKPAFPRKGIYQQEGNHSAQEGKQGCEKVECRRKGSNQHCRQACPELMPMIPGSASGFFITACSSTPETAMAAPPKRAMKMRGNRRS